MTQIDPVIKTHNHLELILVLFLVISKTNSYFETLGQNLFLLTFLGVILWDGRDF